MSFQKIDPDKTASDETTTVATPNYKKMNYIQAHNAPSPRLDNNRHGSPAGKAEEDVPPAAGGDDNIDSLFENYGTVYV